MKKKLYLLLFIISSCAHIFAQEKELLIEFRAFYQGKPLIWDSLAYEYQGKPISFSKLKFYLSNFRLVDQEKMLWEEEESYHLLDFRERSMPQLRLSYPSSVSASGIAFQIGVDSIKSVSGAFGGDLDPVKGMYWAWNSGYINFKLEGNSEISSSRKQEFSYHIGGYMPPFATIQTVRLPLTTETEKILIAIELSTFLEQVDVAKDASVLSPGPDAYQISSFLPQLFSLDDEK